MDGAVPELRLDVMSDPILAAPPEPPAAVNPAQSRLWAVQCARWHSREQ